MNQLTLTERHYSGDIVVVAISGELDVATAVELDDHLIHLSVTGHHRLVLDAARLTFCDASGIHVLVRAQARAAGKLGWLRLAAVDPRLHRILAILALTIALPAFDNVSRAVLGIEAPDRIGLCSGPDVARMARTWPADRYGGA
jgi:anti-sigma B factor antagonist